MRCSQATGEMVSLTRAEWQAFVAAVKENRFDDL
jgi:hypothetical protein